MRDSVDPSHLGMRCPICTGRVAYFSFDTSTGRATCPRCHRTHDRREPPAIKQVNGQLSATPPRYADVGAGI